MSVTIEDIKARCIEEGNCWLWQGALSSRGFPSIKVNGKVTAVRRVVLEIEGRPAKPRQPVVCQCDDRLCVRPIHMKATTRSKVSIRAAESGYLSAKAKRKKGAETIRKSGRVKINIEIAREMRNSTEPGRVLAVRYGVSKGFVGHVRRGKYYQEYSSSPFDGLGARA